MTGAPGSEAPRIVVVGDVITDVVATLHTPLATGSDTPARIRVTGGGQAANTAAWIAAAATPVTLVGVVGTDPDATARIEELRRAGVDCAIRQDPAAPTGTVIVLTTAAERTMVTERGANLLLTGADVTAALAAAPGARHLHLSAYTLLDPVSRPAGLAALAAARERGLTTSVDAASAAPLRAVGPAAFLSWVRGVDLLLANGDEAAALVAAAPGADQACALTATARYAVVKLGAAGAVLAGRDTPPVSLPAAEVRALDTTGAGDAFAAGLLAAWVRGADQATALAAGIRYGAEAVTVTGGRPVR